MNGNNTNINTNNSNLYTSITPTTQLFSSPSLYNMSTSTSTATSSTSALSGLAQLVHSHPSKPYHTNKNLTTIKPSLYSHDNPNSKVFYTRRGLESSLLELEQNKDIDIGLGAYNSSIKHVTASLNQLKSEQPFR